MPPLARYAAALAVALFGCGAPASDEGDAAAPPADTAAPAAAAPVEPVPAAASDTVGALVALDGEGLRIFLIPSGSARPLPFGMPAEDLVTALERVHGGAPVERGENVDCSATYAIWQDGVTTWFDRDRFVGWSVAPSGGTASTASGITVGSTRAELESAYAAEIAPSTLGIEFSAGGLAGILGSDRPDARVLHLWAGAVCLAR